MLHKDCWPFLEHLFFFGQRLRCISTNVNVQLLEQTLLKVFLIKVCLSSILMKKEEKKRQKEEAKDKEKWVATLSA